MGGGATPTPSSHRGRLSVVTSNRRLSQLLVATCLVPAVSLALTACGGSAPESSGTGGSGASGTSAADQEMGHVHGLGVDPADGTLYVASHFGVWRVEDGERELVADRQQDTMGFVVVGPGHFLGSGHPDPDENLPPSLGLIESTDAGETWEPLSLLGEADLHSIEQVGDKVYAYDSTTQSLMVTSDGQRWDVISRLLPLLDIATDPEDPDTVLALTAAGDLIRSTGGAEPTPEYDAPQGLVAIDWEPDGPLVAVADNGAVLVSPDGGSEWATAGALDGPAVALDAAPGRWHAATETGIYESTDDGATWEAVLTHDS